MSTGPISLLPCVPDLSDFIPPNDIQIVQTLKCTPVIGNQLYSLGYASFQVGKYLTETVLDDVFGITGFTGFTGFTGATGAASLSDAIAGAEFWFGRLTVFLVLPWVLIFLGLFIYFGVTGVMSGFAAIIFIIITLVVAGFTLFFVIWDARQTVLRIRNDIGFAVSNTVNDIRSSFNEQIDLYGTDFAGYLVAAYSLEASCNTNEDQVCCGFDPINPGCFNGLTVGPNIVPTSATGTMSFEADFPSGYTSGFLIIPPELNGGTGTTLSLDEPTPESFIYTTTDQPGTARLQAVFIGGGLLPTFEIFSETIFILDATDITGTTGVTGTDNSLDESSAIDGTLTTDTKSSMAQLQEVLQQAQHLQEGLQQRLAKPKEHRRVDQPIQGTNRPNKGGYNNCRGCFKRPLRSKVAPVCPNGNCQ